MISSQTATLLPLLLLITVIVTTTQTSSAVLTPIPSVLNLRPVVPGLIYRSATLDNLSSTDAQSLLSGAAFEDDTARRRTLSAVIDLRNDDEIRKGEKDRTDGANEFYSTLALTDTTARLIKVPILRDVDAFWDETISRMPPGERTVASLKTVFEGNALDRAAARSLERGGLASLYTVMLASCSRPLMEAVEVCVREALEGPVVFHCQKGKDRTGVVAMLLQSCLLEDEDGVILEAYEVSDELLGGDEGAGKGGSSGLIDWSHFRGSPVSAMRDTMTWIRETYGSVDEYLDSSNFDRKLLKEMLDLQSVQKS